MSDGATITPATPGRKEAADTTIMRPLRDNRDFRLLWLGQVFAELGSHASFVALPLLVLTLTGSASSAGLASLVMAVAALAARLPGGAAADRCDRRRVMAWCVAIRAVAMLVLAAALLTQRAPFALVVAVGALDAALGSAFRPAELATVRRLVLGRQLPAALALNQARAAAATLGGPPLGGLLFAIAKAAPFGANAVSYAVSLGCLLLMRARVRPEPPAGDAPPAGGIAAGLLHLWTQPLLRFSALAGGIVNFAMSGVLFAVLVVSSDRGASGLSAGLTVAMAGAGGLAGSLLAPRAAAVLSPRRAIAATCWALAVLVPLMALAPVAPMLGLLLAACCVLVPLANVVLVSLQVLLTPDHLQGRVQAASGLIAMSLAPLGPFLAGVAIESLGVRATFAAFGGVLAALALMALFDGSLRAARLAAPAGE